MSKREVEEDEGGDPPRVRRDEQRLCEDEQHHPTDQQDLQGRHRIGRDLPQRYPGLPFFVIDIEFFFFCIQDDFWGFLFVLGFRSHQSRVGSLTWSRFITF